MTISSTDSRWEYTGDNSTKDFTYSNKIFLNTDLEVYSDNVLQTLTTDYTVSGAGVDGGGTVTYVSAPATDVSIVILRIVPDTQSTDYPAGGSLPSGVIEGDIDRRTIVSQQHQEKIDRSMLTPSGEVQVDMTLQELATRASTYFGFDSDGKPTSLSAPTGTSITTAFSQTLLDDATAGAWLTTLGITAYAQTLLDDATAAAARTTLGLGTAAIVDTGVANGDVPLMDATGYPAADGSQITGVVADEVAWVDVTGVPSLGAMVLLASYSPSAVASVDITSILTSTYKHYIIKCRNLLPAADNVGLLLRTSTDNGVSFDSGASDYQYIVYSKDTAAFDRSAESAAATAINLTASSIGNVAGEGVSCTIELIDPLETAFAKAAEFKGHYRTNLGVFVHLNGSGIRFSTADVDAVQLLFDSGNIASGEIRVYGLKDS